MPLTPTPMSGVPARSTSCDFAEREMAVLSEDSKPMAARRCEETAVRYKANGSAEMTETSLVRARGVVGRAWRSRYEEWSGNVVVSGERREPHPV